MPRSPLNAKLGAAPPKVIDCHGWEIPAFFSSVEEEYRALKTGAGLLDLSHRGHILVRGTDAPRFLHGMVTNDVQGLKPGEGNEAFLLNVHGHILADLRILRLEPDTFLLDCEPQLSEVIIRTLDRHIIADVVELEDCSENLISLGIEGPHAREVASQITCMDIPKMKFLEHRAIENLSLRLVQGSHSGGPGYWILTSLDRAVELWTSILEASVRQPATNVADAIRPIGFEALEICRIERGIPRYGIDITEKNLPQETGQIHAISFTKGCYVGQEVVERIRSRGHVNRKLVRLLFEGRQDVAPQTEILVEGQAVGFTTSSAYSFDLQRTVALAYLRREHAEAGHRVIAGTVPAEVAELHPPL